MYDNDYFISRQDAATVIGVTPARITQMVNEGKLPTEINPINGKPMLIREAVIEYSRTWLPESHKQFGVCRNCQRVFQRVQYRQKGKQAGTYSDGDYCPTCTRVKNENTHTYTSPYIPHPGQLPFHQSKARYRLLNCGSRWGKDRCSINEFIKLFSEMLSEDRGPELIPKVHGWLVAPTFPMANQLWRELKEFFPREWMAANPYEGDKVILTAEDGVIEVKSADDPNALVAVGLDIVLITEAARIKNLEDVWAFLYTRVQSPGRGPGGKGGLIIANSTPVGKGYWYELVRMGRKNDDKYDPEFESFEHPTSSNPYIRPEEIEKARQRLPDRVFRQEFLAEFLDDAANVFTNVDSCATYEGPSEPQEGEHYILAWDPARSVDYSAWGIRNLRGETVKIGRWTGVPFTAQVDRIAELSIRYNFAPVVMDVTGLGKPLPEALEQRGIAVEAVHFTNPLKEQMVNNLAFLIEQKAISYPNDYDLLQELKDYNYSISQSGTIRYSAPKGSYDDLVTMMMMLYKDYQQAEIELPFVGLLMGVSLGPEHNDAVQRGSPYSRGVIA